MHIRLSFFFIIINVLSTFGGEDTEFVSGFAWGKYSVTKDTVFITLEFTNLSNQDTAYVPTSLYNGFISDSEYGDFNYPYNVCVDKYMSNSIYTYFPMIRSLEPYGTLVYKHIPLSRGKGYIPTQSEVCFSCDTCDSYNYFTIKSGDTKRIIMAFRAANLSPFPSILLFIFTYSYNKEFVIKKFVDGRCRYRDCNFGIRVESPKYWKQ